MCGRFTQSSRAGIYEALYGVACPFDLPPRFNVAPSQPVLALIDGASNPQFALLIWGLVPHWAKDPTAIQRPINARAETIADRPMFRDAFRLRRALVPAELFFEWRRTRGRAVPYAFKSTSDAPFSLAAIWDRWQRSGSESIASLSLIVGPANGIVAPIHDRMPVIVPASSFREWLSPETPQARVRQILRSSEDEMECYRVSPAINDPRHEGPDLVRRWEEMEP